MFGQKRRKKPIAYFAMVAVGVFLSTMDSSMMNIALPYIMEGFSVSLAGGQWVVLAYLLSVSASLLFWGEISDRIGKGVIYLVGMLVFLVSALLCAVASSFVWLIIFRCLQGCGAAMMMATGPAILRTVAPEGQIGRWLGSLGIATSIGLMSGPLLGGLVLHTMGWRALFVIHFPVSFTVFLLGWIYLAGTLPKAKRGGQDFDLGGALLWSGIIICIVVLFTSAGRLSPIMAGTLVVALIVMMVLFYRVERCRGEPFLPMDLLRHRYYVIAMLVVSLSFAVLFFVLILMPLYFKYVVGLTSDKIGYMMMAVPISLFIVSPLAGRLFDRVGGVYLTTLGLCITGCATLLLAYIDTTSAMLKIGFLLAILGCGQSIFLSPNSASVLSKVRLEDTGVTAGLLATSRNVGMLGGVAMVSMIFSFFFNTFSDGSALRAYTPENQDAFLRAFRYSLIIAASLAFGSALLSLARK